MRFLSSAEALQMLGHAAASQLLQSHAGTPYQLQLVHLQGSEWQAGQYTGLCHDAFVRLARQSEYDMPTGQDSA